jgi:predicted nucleic acid-binding protein
MISYIVDASVVVQHIVSEPHTPNINILFEDVGTLIKVYVPEFCLLECTNVLWKHVRFSGMPEEIAKDLLADLMAVDLTVVPVIGLMPRALEIGLKHQLAIYDSLYIALAENLKYPLITDDARQAKVANSEGIALKPIIEYRP